MQEETRSPDTYPIDETYPVDVEVLYPERSSRLQALLALTILPKFVLLVPHYFVSSVLQVAALMTVIVGLLMVLSEGPFSNKIKEIGELSIILYYYTILCS